MANNYYPQLFKKGRIGNVELKNRIVRNSMGGSKSDVWIRSNGIVPKGVFIGVKNGLIRSVVIIIFIFYETTKL